MTYNWQQKDWPDFKYQADNLDDTLYKITERVGRVSGLLEGLPEDTQRESLIDIMVAEAVKTSEIEGEYIDREDVMSSIRNKLGFNRVPDQVKDKRAEGAGELMVHVRTHFADALTAETLFTWHHMLMQGQRRIQIGVWRDHEEPMQIISGPIGKEQIHYEAPPSSIVPAEMERFLEWFNNTAPSAKNEITTPVIRAAIAHLYFETIHPFEDGNGRIGRAISEKALSQGIGRPVLLSLSRAIEANKNAYYDALQTAQRSNEITPWLHYFAQTVLDAQTKTEEHISFTLKKAKFFDRHTHQMNERQLRVLNRMLEDGVDSFEGGMSAKKYMRITQTSKATATRDLQDLAAKRILEPFGAGRGVRYTVNLSA